MAVGARHPALPFVFHTKDFELDMVFVPGFCGAHQGRLSGYFDLQFHYTLFRLGYLLSVLALDLIQHLRRPFQLFFSSCVPPLGALLALST